MRGSLRQIIKPLVLDHQNDDFFIWLPTWLNACRPYLVRVPLFYCEWKRCLDHFCPFPLLAKQLSAVLLNRDLDCFIASHLEYDVQSGCNVPFSEAKECLPVLAKKISWL